LHERVVRLSLNRLPAIFQLWLRRYAGNLTFCLTLLKEHDTKSWTSNDFKFLVFLEYLNKCSVLYPVKHRDGFSIAQAVRCGILIAESGVRSWWVHVRSVVDEEALDYVFLQVPSVFSCWSPFRHCAILISPPLQGCDSRDRQHSITSSVIKMGHSSFNRKLVDHRESYKTSWYLNKLIAYGLGERGSIPSGWVKDFL
jgi:hypothetical protein